MAQALRLGRQLSDLFGRRLILLIPVTERGDTMAIDFRRMPQREGETTSEIDGDSGDMKRFFLERLTRLTKKSALLSRYLVPTDRRMRLLNHAILTTYEDCRAVGIGVEAKIVIDESRRESAIASR